MSFSSALRTSRPALNSLRATPKLNSRTMKVLAVLYRGGKHAKEQPRMLGTIENQLGIKEWLAERGHELVVTDDKEGSDSAFAKHMLDAEVLITTPFHPAYVTREVLAKAKNLKLAVTAGVGSDHVDLDAANEKNITVAEVSGSNVVSVAEQVMMNILLLVRNALPAHEQIAGGGWNVAQVAKNAYDLEGKVVGTLGAGRIGYRVLQRLKAFDCKELLYYDYQALPAHAEKEVGAKRIEDLKEFLGKVDILTINAPLHEQTRGLIDKEKLGWMKKNSWIVNTARGAICNKEDIAEAVNSGHILGYAGDVWYPQPAPSDHPWRQMKHPSSEPGFTVGNGMVAHYSGTTLDAQKRYADGTKEILRRYFDKEEQEPSNLIVDKGGYASKAYGERKK